MSEVKNGQHGIPKTAMKSLSCKCGSQVFNQAYRLYHYPGGIYLPKKVNIPEIVWICSACGLEQDLSKTLNNKSL